MIRFEIIIPRAPATQNEILRHYGRQKYVEERTAWKEYLSVWRLKMRDHGSPFWWSQAEDLDEHGHHRPVGIKIVAVYPKPVDFDAAVVKPLIDCLGFRTYGRRKATPRGRSQGLFQGVGVLIDDGPKYVPVPLVVHSIYVHGHSGTFLRVRDAEDYQDIDDDMETRMRGGGEIIGTSQWW